MGGSVSPVHDSPRSLQSVHDAVVASVTQALQLGYRHFDSARIYDTETPLGAAIRDAISAGVVTRDDVFITTKVTSVSDHDEEV